MEWDKLWAINMQHIDPISPRYTAVVADNKYFILSSFFVMP